MNQSAIRFLIIPPSEIETILPLLSKLNDHKIPQATLLERLHEMKTQNYECLGIYDGSLLMGICGMWFQTRHYAGRSLEIDHVIIHKNYRNRGIGKQMMQFIYKYAKNKGCNWVELNTYVDNFPSHKFYYNEGFVAKGYHFVKTI